MTKTSTKETNTKETSTTKTTTTKTTTTKGIPSHGEGGKLNESRVNGTGPRSRQK